MSATRPHLPALDALRGLAVALVFVGHAANDGHLPAWLGGGTGQIGVMLFFALSGFLMAALYAGAPATPATLAAFAAARAGRVLPLYLAVVGLSLWAALAGFAPHYRVADPPVLAAALAMLTAPQELWSIPVEVQFYALFAVLWAIPGGLRPTTLVGLLAVSMPAAAAWRLAVTEAPALPAFLPAFLAGAALARIRTTRGLPRLLAHRAALPLSLAALALMLPAPRAALGLEIWSGFYPRFWLDPPRLAVVVAVLAAAAAAPRLPLQPVLGPLGTLSFGIYLIHRPVMRGLEDVLGAGPPTALAALAVTLALAALSFSLFERPLAGWIRRRASAPRRRPAPGSASW